MTWLTTLLPDSHVDDRRFRPNILIDIPGAAQVERSWRGKVLSVGADVRLRVLDFTERCVMVNLPQADLPGDAHILRSLGRESGPHFGVYAEVMATGTIRLADRVLVSD